MSEDTTETVDSQNDAVESENPDEVTDQSTLVEEESDNVDELKEQLEKQRQQNLKLFKRTKKAEGFEEQPDGTWVKAQKKVTKEPVPVASAQAEMSPMDIYALVRNEVAEEDITEVKDYAKFKGMSVAEALKDPLVKNILSEKAEQRKTSNATNIGKSRSSNTQISEDTLVAKAMKGELPESDEDLERLVEAGYKQIK